MFCISTEHTELVVKAALSLFSSKLAVFAQLQRDVGFEGGGVGGLPLRLIGVLGGTGIVPGEGGCGGFVEELGECGGGVAGRFHLANLCFQ